IRDARPNLVTGPVPGPCSNVPDFDVCNEYDTLSRLTRVTQADPDGLGPQQPPVTEYFFDDAGSIKEVRQPLGRGFTQFFDIRNRLVRSVDAQGTETTYEYDLDNRRTAMIEGGRRTEYEYDERRRLKTITLPDPDGPAEPNGQGSQSAPVTRFDYDAANNRKK